MVDCDSLYYFYCSFPTFVETMEKVEPSFVGLKKLRILFFSDLSVIKSFVLLVILLLKLARSSLTVFDLSKKILFQPHSNKYIALGIKIGLIIPVGRGRRPI